MIYINVGPVGIIIVVISNGYGINLFSVDEHVLVNCPFTIPVDVIIATLILY
jgi:hypothetical protein